MIRPVEYFHPEDEAALRNMETVTEQIAANIHDVWVQNRITEGWQYGMLRNDERKEHLCLVPYADLPEYEKEYDRKTAMATLKVIKKLGFEIVK